MEISVFDGEEDAYWWVLCTEKYFNAKGTPEEVKVTEVVKALRGRALKWCLWWYQRNPQVNWETFTVALLWHFKSEYRDVLPLPEEGVAEENEVECPKMNLGLHTTAQTPVPAKTPFNNGPELLFLDPTMNDDVVTVKCSATIDSASEVTEESKDLVPAFFRGLDPPPLVSDHSKSVLSDVETRRATLLAPFSVVDGIGNSTHCFGHRCHPKPFLPPLGDTTSCSVVDVPIVDTGPYDPGPHAPPVHTTVTTFMDFLPFQLYLDTLLRPLSLRTIESEISVDSKLMTILWNALNIDDKTAAHKFFLPMPACHNLIPLLRDDDLWGPAASDPLNYVNTRSLADTHHMFVKMTLSIRLDFLKDLGLEYTVIGVGHQELHIAELLYTKFVSLVKSAPITHTLLQLSPKGEICATLGNCVEMEQRSSGIATMECAKLIISGDFPLDYGRNYSSVPSTHTGCESEVRDESALEKEFFSKEEPNGYYTTIFKANGLEHMTFGFHYFNVYMANSSTIGNSAGMHEFCDATIIFLFCSYGNLVDDVVVLPISAKTQLIDDDVFCRSSARVAAYKVCWLGDIRHQASYVWESGFYITTFAAPIFIAGFASVGLLIITAGQYGRALNLIKFVIEDYFNGVRPSYDDLVVVLIDIDGIFPWNPQSSSLFQSIGNYNLKAENLKCMLLFRLFMNLPASGWAIILLSREPHQNVTINYIGFPGWSSLMMRADADSTQANEYFARQRNVIQKNGFRCHKELIGARYLNKGYATLLTPKTMPNITLTTPRDYVGLGSHTLSKSGWELVYGAIVLGMGNGTARGGSPNVQINTLDIMFEFIIARPNGQVFKGYTISSDVPADNLYPLIRAEWSY